jgi:hypothetical protein
MSAWSNNGSHPREDRGDHKHRKNCVTIDEAISMSDPARLNSVPKMMLSVTTIAHFDIAPSSRSGGFLSSQQSTNARATIPAKILHYTRAA